MIKAGLEMACFTTHVRLRTLPDSMKTLGLPNIDAMASAKNKNKGITSQYTIGPKCVSQYTGCPIDLSSILISISDFSDCPIKKDYKYNKNPNGLTQMGPP